MLVERVYLVSKRFFGVPTFFNMPLPMVSTISSFPDKTGISHIRREKKPDFQLCFAFWEETG
jgi:hypothetical protein